MSQMINIKGIDKAELLAALYNRSQPQGMGFLQVESNNMTKNEAQEILKQTTSFDYLKGRVMKVELKDDEMEEWLYDRDLGQGACQQVIDSLK